MLQSIRVTPGERMLLREKPDPGSPHLLRFFGGEAVDVTDPQPAIPAGAAGTAADWAFVSFQTQNGWVERRFLGETQAPEQVPINQADFVKECVRAEIDYNAGGDGESFPVDADYLIAWALIASEIKDLPADPANDGASGPFALTDAEWKEYLAEVPPDGDAADRNIPLMHVYPAAYLSRKRMQALSGKLTDPALQDGPYVPTYLNVFHAQLLGVDAAAEVQKLLTAKQGATTLATVLAKAVPDQAARDALAKRHEKFLKDGSNPQTVEGFRAKTSRLLNDRFTRAFKLIKQHMPEAVPPKADIGATGSWLAIAEQELKAWEDGKLSQKSGEGKRRVLDYFKATDLQTDKVLSWCGAFVAHCLKTSGDPAASSIIKGASWAANWKTWADTKLFLRAEDNSANGIPKGAVVLLEPLAPKASGHVGFFHSLKEGNKIVLLGGNQSGKVCLRAFPRGKLVAIRWLAAAPKFTLPQDDTPVAAGGAVAGGTPVAGATNQDVLILARTLYGEARGEFNADGQGDKAVEAVANVVLNRVAKKFRGRTTVRDVCLHRKQFSCWNGNDTNRAKIMNLVKGSDPVFDRCLAVATRAIKGQFPDHTDGALHYFATRIPKPDWVVNSPKAKPTLKIGGHIFYKGID
jgi:uncharacterized protein (TIGR02594 family)